MASLTVSVVAVDRNVWSGDATSLVAATTEGEIGILASHEPVLAVLKPGAVRIKPVEGPEINVVVDGGFFSVDSNQVRVLTGYAFIADDMDAAATREALEGAKLAGDRDREAVLTAHLESLTGSR